MKIFPQFTAQIKQHIGKENYENLSPRFSTTGEAEKVVFEMSLMDAMKNYFSYEVVTMCGIPKVKLLGKIED